LNNEQGTQMKNKTKTCVYFFSVVIEHSQTQDL